MIYYKPFPSFRRHFPWVAKWTLDFNRKCENQAGTRYLHLKFLNMASSTMNKYEDFVKMDVQTLRDYLTTRGISVSGYKKAEMVARAFSAAEMGLPIILTSEEQSKLLKEEYRKLLAEFDLTDPRKIDAELKVDDITTWPPVTLGNIFQYILSIREFNTDYVGKYKDQKAYSYFDSGFVGETLIHSTKKFHILFCKVRASMSIHDEKELWILIQPNGKILTCWCSCMAGSSRCCNHVIATLYKMEYANTHGYCSPACTSVPCGWNKSTKRSIEPRMITDIVVRKKIRSQMGENPEDMESTNREETRMIELNKFDPREKVHQKMTNERLSLLIHKLSHSNPSAVVFKSIEEMSIPTSKNLTVIGIATEVSKINLSDSEKITKLLKKLIFSDKEKSSVESTTRNQSESKCWIDHRKGRLTASKHHEYYTKINTVLKTRGKIQPKTTQLVSSLIYQNNDLSKLQAIKWGREHEKDALRAFYSLEATKHVDFKLEKAGLFLDKARAYIGASPDALMYCKCHGKAVIEIKCPFNIKDAVIIDSFQKCEFLTKINDSIILKSSHKYYTQLNSQMALAGTKIGYFVVWTKKDILIQQIPEDKKFWMTVSTNLEIFFKNYVAKRILGINPLLFCGSCENVILEENELRENELDLKPICCKTCNILFHLKCQGLKSIVDSWQCNFCVNIAP